VPCHAAAGTTRARPAGPRLSYGGDLVDGANGRASRHGVRGGEGRGGRMSKPNRGRSSDRPGQRMEFRFSSFCAVQVNCSAIYSVRICVSS
jgi:hypothetical protein